MENTLERKMFELTQRQLKKCHAVEMPGDEWFQERWKKGHHGKLAGWGMGKRNFVLGSMTCTPEYQRGLWQGRVDKLRGLPYAEERNENTYNLGYHRGYTSWDNNSRNGFDEPTYTQFVEQYSK